MTARIGLIIPSSNRMVEEEMVRHVPPGVTAHVARLRMTGAHRVSLDALLPQVKETAATLIDARCDVVAFHCTANSTSEGVAGEGIEQEKEIAERTAETEEDKVKRDDDRDLFRAASPQDARRQEYRQRAAVRGCRRNDTQGRWLYAALPRRHRHPDGCWQRRGPQRNGGAGRPYPTR